MIGIFTVAALVSGVASHYISSHINEQKNSRGLLVRWTVEFFGILLVLTIVISYIWENIFDRFIRIADPWLTFVPFLPISWEPVFMNATQTNFQPIGSFFTTGQIATLYYSCAMLVMVLTLVVFAVHKRSVERFVFGSITIAMLLLILATASIVLL